MRLGAWTASGRFTVAMNRCSNHRPFSPLAGCFGANASEHIANTLAWAQVEGCLLRGHGAWRKSVQAAGGLPSPAREPVANIALVSLTGVPTGIDAYSTECRAPRTLIAVCIFRVVLSAIYA